MDEEKTKPEYDTGIKFDPQQYALLTDCLNNRDLAPWNEWRVAYPEAEIRLEGAKLQEACLFRANLQGAWLDWADLQGADLQGAELQGASLFGANLQGGVLAVANLQEARLDGADLQGATLTEANLQGARLDGADLQGAWLKGANLQGVWLYGAKLQGARLKGANLQGARFTMSQVDAQTTISNCLFDTHTDFTGAGLEGATIDPGLKAAFKNNIRRIQWRKWFGKGKWYARALKKFFVRPFWWATDYGGSTWRIISVFLGLTFIFAGIYVAFETVLGRHGIVQYLRIDGAADNWHIVWRALYFSVVTMTTLGFGDMHAVESADLWGFLGCLILSLQVIAGYVLLGALVTRLGILFTSEAPAATPMPNKKKEIEP